MEWVCTPTRIHFGLTDATPLSADMSQKVYRHLIEQRWRNEGALDLLVCCLRLTFSWCYIPFLTNFQMERLYQMHVIPDILPVLKPTVDLRAVFPEAPPNDAVLRARAKRKTAPVEAGVFLVNEQVYARAKTDNSSILNWPRIDASPAKALHDRLP